MANMNFTDYEAHRASAKGFKERVKVGYFNSLKDDGDEAVVRFAYNTKKDFNVVTVHRVKVEDKWRNVACLKGPYDPVDNCPLCASGNKMLTKVFVNLIDYVKNEQGVIEVQPKVWERPLGFVADLEEAIKDAIEDGKVTPETPIRDIVFKIRRVGAKGSLDTKYKLKVMQPAVVPESTFTKDFSAFEGFDVAHHSYTVKTEAEVAEFLKTGTFPKVEKAEKKAEPVAATPVAAQPEAEPVATPVTAPAAAPVATPAAAETTVTNKPKRYAF